MNRKFYLLLSTVAVAAVFAVAVFAQGSFLQGDWFDGNAPLSSPVSATKPLSSTNMVTPPGWTSRPLTKDQVVKLSAAGQTVLTPQSLPLGDLPAGNQQPWIKRIQLAYLLERTLGFNPYASPSPVFPDCEQKVVDSTVPNPFPASPNATKNTICFAVTKGLMPTLSAPVKDSFYGGQNISRVVAAGVLQRAFDPNAASQIPPTYYADGGKGGQDMYTDVAPYMWSVYWLGEVGATDVAPFTGQKFRPYDSLTIPEAMSWLKALYNLMPKENWVKP